MSMNDFMTMKNLAVELSKLQGFEGPKRIDEQYQTDSEIAATILWEAGMLGWIKGKRIADFGAGTGVLGIGCVLLGAARVEFYEKDSDAVRILRRNIERIKGNYDVSCPIKVFLKDVNEVGKLSVDCVVQNPPFGTGNKGADMVFLDKSGLLSKRIISLHKAETKGFVDKWAENHGFSVVRYNEFSFPLKQTMPDHRKRIQRIRVGAWFMERANR